MVPTNPNLPIVRRVMSRYLTGMLCGTSATGLTSIWSVPLVVLAQMSDLESPNDGLIETTKCQAHASDKYTPFPESHFYLANVNHADGTCRNGNGWWGSERRPCDYYEKQV